MEGRSQILVGLTAVVVVDSLVYLSGPLLMLATSIAAGLLVKKGIFCRFGFPPNPQWRFRSGSWLELVIDGLCLILVALVLWYAVLRSWSETECAPASVSRGKGC
jgi:hypothetical protein